MGSHYQRTSVSHHHHYNNRDPGQLRKYNKQQFLQANCQFVVLDGHNYTIHKVDPDCPVDWDCIEEVRFKQCSSTETACPICLEPPIAAKITKCGHIYCWNCILHYLSLSDEKCRQCPICFEPVHKCDLRSVVSHSFTSYTVDDEITLKLMIRKKGCVEVEPYINENSVDSIIRNVSNDILPDSLNNEQEHQSRTSTLSSDHNKNNNDHYWSQANLVIVDSNTVIDKIIQRERDELLIKFALEKDEAGVCFVEQALKWLDKRVERLQHPNQHQLQSKSTGHHNHVNTSENYNQKIIRNNEFSKNYLFYQCSDGQHIYLNPFSTKILLNEYKSLENCPKEIKAKIVQMDWISMNEALRKRFRYLEHLPLTCEFILIEINFEKSKLISNETYKIFEEQIKKRAQERQRRRREERKREKIIQVEQDRKIYGIQPSLNINLNNTDQFPSVSDERYLGHTQSKNRAPNQYDFSSSSEDDDNNLVNEQSIINETSTINNENDHNHEQTTSKQVISNDLNNGHSSDVIPNEAPDLMSAMSFKDIQLQEAALMKAQLEKQKRSNQLSGAWPNNSSSSKQSPSSKQSSFAQLLVNAKISHKQWTRNINPTIATSSNALTTTNNITSYGHNNRQKTSESDDGGEELRAPPNEFRISDFMDLNISTGKKKGKSKKS